MKPRRTKPNQSKRIRHKNYFTDILVTVAVILNNDQDILEKQFQGIFETLRKYSKYFEILVIENGSSDNTRPLLFQLQKRIPNIRALILSRKFSLQSGIAAALENSIGDYVVLLDLRNDPPSLIPRLVKSAQSGNDVVIARSTGDTHFYLPFRRSYSRILSRAAVTAITKAGNKNGYVNFYNDLPGLTQTEMDYRSHRARHSLFDRQDFSLDLFSLISGLRVATYLGVFATLANVCLFTLFLYQVLVLKNSTQTGIDVSLITTGMFAMIFLILTVMTTFMEKPNGVRDRARYHIVEEVTSSVIAETDRVNVV